MALPSATADVFRSGPVLVTGAGGFIGRNLVDALIQIGADVAVLVRSIGPRLAGIQKSIRILECDLLRADKLAAQIDVLRPAVVFHLAAGVAAGIPDATIIESNVVGTANLLRALEKQPIKNFVLVGSGFEYGAGRGLQETSPLRPVNVYGATKAAAHLLAHSFRRSRGLPVISVRPFTPYGSWEAPWRLIPFVIARCIEGGKIPLTKGEQERDFIFIDDVVDALLRAAGVVGTDELEAINICNGTPVTIRDVVQTIIELTGNKATPDFGALPYRSGELWIQSGDPARAHSTLGWTPDVLLREGLQQTVDWVERNRALLHTMK
jgi:UDP-glucose 4-epimerase